MKRAPLFLTLAAALACASAACAQDPAGQGVAADGQVVRDPGGHLVHLHGGRTAGQQAARSDVPPVASSYTATGNGCTKFTDAYGSYAFFCRAGAQQIVQSTGAYMTTTVQSLAIHPNDEHSLVELAVQSRDGAQIVEIGVKTRRSDGVPRLFIYKWVNGVGKGYDASAGYQSAGTSISPGMQLTPGAQVRLMIQYSGGNWWLGLNDTWFGSYPSSLWGGTYTTSGLVRVFGEVSSLWASAPCTDMGNGAFGASASAATISGVTLFGASVGTALTTFTPDDASLYNAQLTSSNGLRYGGPGNTTNC